MAKIIPIPPSGFQQLIWPKLPLNQTYLPADEPLPPPEEGEAPPEGDEESEGPEGPLKAAVAPFAAPLGAGVSPFSFTYTALPPLTGAGGLIDDNSSNSQTKSNFSAIWNYLAALFGTSGQPSDALTSLTASGGIGATGGSTTGPVTIGPGISSIAGAALGSAINSASSALIVKWAVNNNFFRNDYVSRFAAGSDWQTALWQTQWVVDTTVQAVFTVKPIGGPIFTWSNASGSIACSFNVQTGYFSAPVLQSSSIGSNDATVLVANPGANTSSIINSRSAALCGIWNNTAARWRGYFDASENFVATGNVSAFSDKRLKKDVQAIYPKAASVILRALRGVRYTRKDTGEAGVGFIAQEVAQLVPEAVQEGADGMLTLAYGNLLGVVVPALQDYMTEVDELRVEVRELRQKLEGFQGEFRR